MSPPMPPIPFGAPFHLRRRNDRSLPGRLHSVRAAADAGSDIRSDGAREITQGQSWGWRAGRVVLILLVLLATTAVSVRPGPVQAASPAPAASYQLDASVDLDKDTVTVGERVAFRNVVGVPLETLVFHVVANTIGSMSLTSATIDGQTIPSALGGSMLELMLARPLPPGGSTQIDLKYALKVPNEPGRLTSTSRGMVL